MKVRTWLLSLTCYFSRKLIIELSLFSISSFVTDTLMIIKMLALWKVFRIFIFRVNKFFFLFKMVPYLILLMFVITSGMVFSTRNGISLISWIRLSTRYVLEKVIFRGVICEFITMISIFFLALCSLLCFSILYVHNLVLKKNFDFCSTKLNICLEFSRITFPRKLERT